MDPDRWSARETGGSCEYRVDFNSSSAPGLCTYPLETDRQTDPCLPVNDDNNNPNRTTSTRILTLQHSTVIQYYVCVLCVDRFAGPGVILVGIIY
jgi:hypothetical protein